MNNDHVIPPRINSFYGSNKSSNQSHGQYFEPTWDPGILSYVLHQTIFRFRVLAALVLCLLTMGPCHPRTLSGAPQSPATGRRGSEVASPGVRRQHVISEDTGQQCTEMRSQYLRSQCRDNGFLTVQRNRVLVQTTGLNTTHVEGKRVTMKNVTHTRSHGILAFCLHLLFLMNGWM